MSDITLRGTKGSPLTNQEVDDNFDNLNTEKLQSGDTAASLTISSADINGGTIDGTVIGATTTAAGSFTTITASGEIAANGGIALGDNDKATFGAGDDLQIYHDGSHSYVKDVGTGYLYVGGSAYALIQGGSYNCFAAANTGEATIYYQGNPKLTTTATGIDITGTATMDGLTVDGASDLNGNVTIGSSITTLLTGNDIDFQRAGDSYLSQTGGGALSIRTNDGVSNKIRMNLASNGDIRFYEDTGTTPKFVWSSFAESLTVPILITTGNTTLGDASTDTVRVNGYMGVGGAPSASTALTIASTALTSTQQFGVSGQITGTSSATSLVAAIDSYPQTANASFTTNNVAGFYARAGLKGGSNTASNWHGLYVSDQTQGTNNYGITSLVSSGTNKWNIYASGTAQNYFAGSVGIGKAPATALDVAGTITADGLTVDGDIDITEPSPTITFTDTSDSSVHLIQSINSALNIQGQSQVRLSTGATERMRIDASGNVGIGTSSPTNVANYNSVSVNGTTGSLIDSYYGGTLGGRIQAYSSSYFISAQGESLPLVLGTNNTERMRIDSSGNLLVGGTSKTSVPSLDNGVYLQSQTNGDVLGYSLYSNEGTNNRRVAFFLDDTNGVYGFDASAASGVPVFIIRRAGTESMRIDSSGNLLVGKSISDVGATAGFEWYDTANVLTLTRNAGHALSVNRLNDDGVIVQFRKDSTVVGSIGSGVGDSLASTLYIADAGNVGIRFDQASTDDIQPCTSTGADRDNAINLGATDNRFKDLYLSGTINAGADASINGLTVGRGGGSVSSNTAVGSIALQSNIDGINNTANGVNALRFNTSGSYNTASGLNALHSNISGSFNTASGVSALRSNASSSYNSASGFEALYSNTTGSYNSASGAYALLSNTSGSLNTASGAYALYSNTTGSSNTASGVNALRANSTGNYNSASGVNALYLNNNGSYNSASSFEALFSNISGSYNTASGAYALYSNIDGEGNSAFGVDALYSNTSGSSNTASGRYALRSNTTGSANLASGVNALRSNISGNYNSVSGFEALYSNTIGSFNTASGAAALRSNIDGIYNSAYGVNALWSNTSGSYNTASGVDALFSNSIGSYNSASGTYALRANTSGSNNSASGAYALNSNISGSSNTASGIDALRFNTSGSNNSASGVSALRSNTSGSSNSAFGVDAGNLITTGSKNTILGRYNGNQGGLDIRTANNNIVLSDGDGNPRLVNNGSVTAFGGTIPSAWSGFTALDVGASSYTGDGSGSARIYGNNYYDGAYKYRTTGTATLLANEASGSYFYVASSGSAGATISWTNVYSVQKDSSFALQGADSQSGTGITFPAIQNASSNPNTLDDYEEGNWTPALQSDGGTTGTQTDTVIWGKYVKVGRKVTVWFRWTGTLSEYTGTLLIGGLPFSVGISDDAYQFGGSFSSSSSTATESNGSNYLFFAYSSALYPRFSTGQSAGYLFVGSTQINGLTNMYGSHTFYALA